VVIWCGPFVTSSQQVLVLEAVVQLDHEVTKLLSYADVLPYSSGTEVIASLRTLLSMVTSAMSALRERVLASRYQTALLEAEAVLHARAAVLAVQVIELRHSARELAPGALDGAGSLQSVNAFCDHILDRITQVTTAWWCERHDLKTTVSDPSSYYTLYHTVLDNAEHGLTAIGKEPDIERFLQVGANAEARRFRIACQTIAATLDLALIPELLRSAYLSEQPVAASGRGRR
jgi:hypothetical protein